MQPRYIIISPVRNEGKRLGLTIESVVGQSVRPAEWIIVDDGSTDDSPQILSEAARQHPWIRSIRRADRGARKPGTGVIEAFYDGYQTISAKEWDFIVKMDGDVSFERDYFEKCFAEFASDKTLGIGGGLVCKPNDRNPVPESPNDPVFHVRGATKIYRRECWDAIGQLIRAPGWDTLDELKANMLGWTTRTFQHVRLLHHKFAGSADGAWVNWVKNGMANYIVGYHPVFMLAKSMNRLREKPYGVAGAGLLFGFCSGYLKRVPQIEDKELIKFLRREQIKRLLLKESLWSA
jgi:poly-beta-1,6-N-acetyl-D-glucosamine synthase